MHMVSNIKYCLDRTQAWYYLQSCLQTYIIHNHMVLNAGTVTKIHTLQECQSMPHDPTVGPYTTRSFALGVVDSRDFWPLIVPVGSISFPYSAPIWPTLPSKDRFLLQASIFLPGRLSLDPQTSSSEPRFVAPCLRAKLRESLEVSTR